MIANNIFILLLVAVAYRYGESKVLSRDPVRGASQSLSRDLVSSCLVVENIRQHNSDRLWWWSRRSKRPKVVNKPRQTFGNFSKEWLIFSSIHEESRNVLTEVAHALRNGKCRFLIQKLKGRRRLAFTKANKCMPGLYGERSVFSLSSDAVTDRVQITAGSKHVFEDEKKFVGLKDKFLVLTKLRQKDMSWWTIDFNKAKECPGKVFHHQ